MKLSELIVELQHVQAQHGDIEAQLQSFPEPGEAIINDDTIFVVPELYQDEGEEEMICNIRAWPY